MVAGLVLIRGVISRPTLVRFAKTVAATAAMAACVSAVHGLGLLVQVATGMVTFTAFALLLRIATEPEWQEVSELLRRAAWLPDFSGGGRRQDGSAERAQAWRHRFGDVLRRRW